MHPYVIRAQAIHHDGSANAPHSTAPEDAEAVRLASERAEQEKRQEIYEQARREGIALGRQQGLEQVAREGNAAIERAVNAAAAMIADLRDERDAAIRQMAQGAVQIGISLAERLLSTPVLFDRSALLDHILSEAMGAIQPGRRIMITAHPSLFDPDAELPDIVDRTTDETMVPGGFIIRVINEDGHSTFASWDASIENAMAALKRVEIPAIDRINLSAQHGDADA